MALTKDEFAAKLDQQRTCYAYVTVNDKMYFLRCDDVIDDAKSISDLFTDSLRDAMLFDIDDALLMRDMFAFLADTDLQIVRLSTTVEWITD